MKEEMSPAPGEDRASGGQGMVSTSPMVGVGRPLQNWPMGAAEHKELDSFNIKSIFKILLWRLNDVF